MVCTWDKHTTVGSDSELVPTGTMIGKKAEPAMSSTPQERRCLEEMLGRAQRQGVPSRRGFPVLSEPLPISHSEGSTVGGPHCLLGRDQGRGEGGGLPGVTGGLASMGAGEAGRPT